MRYYYLVDRIVVNAGTRFEALAPALPDGTSVIGQIVQTVAEQSNNRRACFVVTDVPLGNSNKWDQFTAEQGVKFARDRGYPEEAIAYWFPEAV